MMQGEDLALTHCPNDRDIAQMLSLEYHHRCVFVGKIVLIKLKVLEAEQ